MRNQLIEIKQDDPNPTEMSQNYPNWTKVVQICKDSIDVNPAKWSKIDQVEQNSENPVNRIGGKFI